MYKRFGTAVYWLSIVVLLAAVVDAWSQSQSYLVVCAGLGNSSDVFVAISISWFIVGLLLFRMTQRLANPCLGQSLAAGLLGVTLIVIEAIIEIFCPCQKWGGFHLEELLLASGGLNMLMEEVRLSDEYMDLLVRRRDASDQTDQIIKDMSTFRGMILAAAQKNFGIQRPKPSSIPSPAPSPAMVVPALKAIDEAIGRKPPSGGVGGR